MNPSLNSSLHFKARGDKTTCFLNMLGLENLLVSKLLTLAEQSPFQSQIERIIKEHVGELKIEGATDPVSYDGVAELGASGVTLQFTCHCKEKDYYSVDRELKGAVKNMFDEYGIGIPFPQVVVHNGDK